MMAELAVLLEDPEEDEAWWSIVTHSEEDGGVVNDASQHLRPTTRAASGCNMMRG
jgi:hypothetical protein